MKHALILAHPRPDSFNGAVAQAYAGMARQLKHEVIARDLYQMGFDPLLKAGEIPGPKGFAPAPDIVAERAIIGEADVFAFVYPLWFYAPPAILMGYVDRVFGMGFGFGAVQGGANSPLLTGRKMINFTSTGSPMEWLRQEGNWSAIRTIFDSHLAQVCGLTVLDHVHFGGVTAGMRPDAVEERLGQVRETVLRLF